MAEVHSTSISQRAHNGALLVDEVTGAVLSAEMQMQIHDLDYFMLLGDGSAFRFSYKEFIESLTNLRNDAIRAWGAGGGANSESTELDDQQDRQEEAEQDSP